MKAISLWQPWASLVAYEVKPEETRSWMAPRGYWGQRIAIHAAKRLMVLDHLPSDLRRAVIAHDLTTPPYGAVVATAVLKECRQVPDPRDLIDPSSPLPGLEQTTRPAIEPNPYGDFSPGRWIWYLTDIKRFDDPALARGRQGFWDWALPILTPTSAPPVTQPTLC